MKAILPGLLIGCAFIAATWGYGWRGLVMAVTAAVFWALLQFRRSLRVLERAGRRPLGVVTNAVMLSSRIEHGMDLQELIALAGSLGEKVGEPDDWRWHDAGGAEVVVALRRGRVVRWSLARGEPPAPPTEPPASEGHGP